MSTQQFGRYWASLLSSFSLTCSFFLQMITYPRDACKYLFFPSSGCDEALERPPPTQSTAKGPMHQKLTLASPQRANLGCFDFGRQAWRKEYARPLPTQEDVDRKWSSIPRKIKRIKPRVPKAKLKVKAKRGPSERCNEQALHCVP